MRAAKTNANGDSFSPHPKDESTDSIVTGFFYLIRILLKRSCSIIDNFFFTGGRFEVGRRKHSNVFGRIVSLFCH